MARDPIKKTSALSSSPLCLKSVSVAAVGDGDQLESVSVAAVMGDGDQLESASASCVVSQGGVGW